MDWISVIILIFAFIAGEITLRVTENEKTIVSIFDFFKLITFYKTKKRIEYILLFIIDMIIILSLPVYLFCF